MASRLLQALNAETSRLERKYLRRLTQAAEGVRVAILRNLTEFYDQGLPPSMASGAMASALEERHSRPIMTWPTIFIYKAPAWASSFQPIRRSKTARQGIERGESLSTMLRLCAF